MKKHIISILCGLSAILSLNGAVLTDNDRQAIKTLREAGSNLVSQTFVLQDKDVIIRVNLNETFFKNALKTTLKFIQIFGGTLGVLAIPASMFGAYRALISSIPVTPIGPGTGTAPPPTSQEIRNALLLGLAGAGGLMGMITVEMIFLMPFQYLAIRKVMARVREIDAAMGKHNVPYEFQKMDFIPAALLLAAYIRSLPEIKKIVHLPEMQEFLSMPGAWEAIAELFFEKYSPNLTNALKELLDFQSAETQKASAENEVSAEAA